MQGSTGIYRNLPLPGAESTGVYRFYLAKLDPHEFPVKSAELHRVSLERVDVIASVRGIYQTYRNLSLSVPESTGVFRVKPRSLPE